MPKKLRRPKERENLSEDMIAWLTGSESVPMAYFADPEGLAELWRAWGQAFVSEHIAEFPGTRPYRWWKYDAPEPRRRLGGIGTPAHERLAHVLCLIAGVPAIWIGEHDLRIYKMLGRPLGVPALDPKDPPLFESEAAYLDRLGLLSAPERKQLTTDDFKPVPITDIIDLD